MVGTRNTHSILTEKPSKREKPRRRRKDNTKMHVIKWGCENERCMEQAQDGV
jgi:hypothetical protein